MNLPQTCFSLWPSRPARPKAEYTPAAHVSSLVPCSKLLLTSPLVVCAQARQKMASVRGERFGANFAKFNAVDAVKRNEGHLSTSCCPVNGNDVDEGYKEHAFCAELNGEVARAGCGSRNGSPLSRRDVGSSSGEPSFKHVGSSSGEPSFKVSLEDRVFRTMLLTDMKKMVHDELTPIHEQLRILTHMVRLNVSSTAHGDAQAAAGCRECCLSSSTSCCRPDRANGGSAEHGTIGQMKVMGAEADVLQVRARQHGVWRPRMIHRADRFGEPGMLQSKGRALCIFMCVFRGAISPRRVGPWSLQTSNICRRARDPCWPRFGRTMPDARLGSRMAAAFPHKE